MANCLIVGGTSGLGLDLARIFAGVGHSVTVTGRRQIHEQGIDVLNLELGEADGVYTRIEQGAGLDRVFCLPSFKS